MDFLPAASAFHTLAPTLFGPGPVQGFEGGPG